MDPSTNRSNGDSRRSFAKKAALATGGALLGSAVTGTGAAQQEDDPGDERGEDTFVNDEKFRCIVYRSDFRPFEEFIITSGVIDWNPAPAVDLGSQFKDYNTRILRYRRTGEHAPFFVAEDARLAPYDPERGYVDDDEGELADGDTVDPQVFAMRSPNERLEGTPDLVRAFFTPVEEDFEDFVWDDDEEPDQDDEWPF